MIEASERWKELYPDAHVGVLVVRGANNPPTHEGLDTMREKVEAELRDRFPAGGKEALRTDPVLAAYESYYKRFKKTYHVAPQIESIAGKGRRIPSVSALVTAMFMAELKNGLLTAGHDLGRIALPIRIDVGTDSESYTAMGGAERIPKEGDMRISDANGIISSIIYGPDNRTAIGPGTTDLLFTVYAPSGVGRERVQLHLEDIKRFVTIVAPGAVAEPLEICSAR
jgi:DNA/RNA-binding domain of Phe-tRNA-synthetase-like protein